MAKSTTNTYTLTKFLGPELSEKDKMHCEKPITPPEVANIIAICEKKSPGIDSLPIEFYIFFWLDIKDFS